MLYFNKTIYNTFSTCDHFECKFSLLLKKGCFLSRRLKKARFPVFTFFRFCSTFSKSFQVMPSFSDQNLTTSGASGLSANKVQLSLKANYLQNILLLTKFQKIKTMLSNLNCKSFVSGQDDLSRCGQSKKTTFSTFCKKSNIFKDLFKQKLNLKPFSTVSGFKKFMINSVKVNQNQLQPGYNRRKHCHSHYNQILKEKSHLSKLYGHLSKSQVSFYSAFTLNSCFLNEFEHSKRYQRPIPKLVFFLESRLDVILWKNLQSESFFNAKQLLRKGIYLNGGLQKKSSIPALPGDVFEFN